MPGAVDKGASAKKKAAAAAAAPAAEPASKESAVLNLSTKVASIDLEKDKHLSESGSVSFSVLKVRETGFITALSLKIGAMI